jgi:hypothetical protein
VVVEVVVVKEGGWGEVGEMAFHDDIGWPASFSPLTLPPFSRLTSVKLRSLLASILASHAIRRTGLKGFQVERPILLPPGCRHPSDPEIPEFDWSIMDRVSALMIKWRCDSSTHTLLYAALAPCFRHSILISTTRAA